MGEGGGKGQKQGFIKGYLRSKFNLNFQYLRLSFFSNDHVTTVLPFIYFLYTQCVVAHKQERQEMKGRKKET